MMVPSRFPAKLGDDCVSTRGGGSSLHGAAGQRGWNVRRQRYQSPQNVKGAVGGGESE